MLLRFRYHPLFLTVIISALIASAVPPTVLLMRLALLYVSFAIFLYGGLYTINGIADRGVDAVHVRKRHRPVASGRVSPPHAWVLSLILIAAAVCTAYVWFGSLVVEIYAVFIVCNLLYTYVTKKIPYVEILGNSVTHPLRAFLGIFIAGGGTGFATLIAAVFFLAIVLATARRIAEKRHGHERGRPVLRYYRMTDLYAVQFFGIAAMAVLLCADPTMAWLHALLMLLGVIVIFGPECSTETENGAWKRAMDFFR